MNTLLKPKIKITFEYEDEQIIQINVLSENQEGQNFLKEFWECSNGDGDIGVFGNDPNTLLITTHRGNSFDKKIAPTVRRKIEKFFGGISFMRANFQIISHEFLKEGHHDFCIKKKK